MTKHLFILSIIVITLSCKQKNIELALNKPSNLDELQQLKGFGKQKAAKFGEDILAILSVV